ncbi:5-oxoprolinase subunit B/C family protein [Leucobacter sp. GX0328]
MSTCTAAQHRAVGDRAVIYDLPGLDRVLEFAAVVRELGVSGVIDIVPASRTVLVVCESRAAVRAVVAAVAGAGAEAGVREAGRIAERPGDGAGGPIMHDIAVRYDGEDLDEVARLTGLGREAVVDAHTRTLWQAAFGGYAPGFAYLVGGDPRLRVPRLDSPRTAVPAGSVALAGEYSAVYPAEAPGGWRLIGRTDAPVWDASRPRPALIAPGDTVRFTAVRERVDLPARDGRIAPEAPPPAGPAEHAAAPKPDEHLHAPAACTVQCTGMLALLQDLGRPGNAAIGVVASGALDRDALRRANRAVGNAESATAIEFLNGGLAITAERPLVIALDGAESAALIDGARHAPWGAAFALGTGETLRIAAPEHGLRGVLAIAGGIAARRVLGSAAHDSLSRLGPPPLASGDRFELAEDPAPALPGETTAARPAATVPGRAAPAAPRRPDPRPVLRFVPGPRDDWFTPEALASFAAQRWQVDSRSNRIGLRLAGAPLERAKPGELPSEGMVHGSIQVPPNGQPLVFLADHPTTGGYPVIGTVVDADLDRAAQLRPGTEVRFAAVDPDGIGDPLDDGAPPGPEAPERVEAVLEVDGRRRAVVIPGALAAALDAAASAGDRRPLELIVRQIVRALERVR